jgi:hypothetical protein
MFCSTHDPPGDGAGNWAFARPRPRFLLMGQTGARTLAARDMPWADSVCRRWPLSHWSRELRKWATRGKTRRPTDGPFDVFPMIEEQHIQRGEPGPSFIFSRTACHWHLLVRATFQFLLTPEGAMYDTRPPLSFLTPEARFRFRGAAFPALPPVRCQRLSYREFKSFCLVPPPFLFFQVISFAEQLSSSRTTTAAPSSRPLSMFNGFAICGRGPAPAALPRWRTSASLC